MTMANFLVWRSVILQASTIVWARECRRGSWRIEKALGDPQNAEPQQNAKPAAPIFFHVLNPFLSILFSSPSPSREREQAIMKMSIMKMSIGRQVRRKAAGDRDIEKPISRLLFQCDLWSKKKEVVRIERMKGMSPAEVSVTPYLIVFRRRKQHLHTDMFRRTFRG